MVVAVNRFFADLSWKQNSILIYMPTYVFYERSTAKFVSFEYQGDKISKKMTEVIALILLKNHRSDALELVEMAAM